MEFSTSEILKVLQYLLPGFISSWVFYGLTYYPKPSPFERVVQALIYTLFIQVLVIIVNVFAIFIGENWFALGIWSQKGELVISVLLGFIVGIILSYLANGDKIHNFLRKIGITQETSYPSEWYSVFAENNTYIVLHLNGERRLYGFPDEWPNSSEKGHFIISNPRWLLDDKEEQILDMVKNIIVPASDVEMVEFMKLNEKVEEESKENKYVK